MQLSNLARRTGVPAVGQWGANAAKAHPNYKKHTALKTNNRGLSSAAIFLVAADSRHGRAFRALGLKLERVKGTIQLTQSLRGVIQLAAA